VKLKAKAYKENIDGTLELIGSGECLAYTPVLAKGVSEDKAYVSLNFGTHRIHINKEDFTRFCKNFLYNNVGSTNASRLR